MGDTTYIRSVCVYMCVSSSIMNGCPRCTMSAQMEVRKS